MAGPAGEIALDHRVVRIPPSVFASLLMASVSACGGFLIHIPHSPRHRQILIASSSISPNLPPVHTRLPLSIAIFLPPMKTTSIILSLISFCIASLCHADTFILAGKPIEVPTPEGFVKVTEDMPMVYKLVQQLVDPGNEMLAYYISESDATIALEGEIPGLERTLVLKINKQLKELTVSRADFKELKGFVKKQNQEIFEKVLADTAQPMSQMSEGLSKEFDIDFAMQVSQVIPMEAHAETVDTIAYSMYINYGLKVEDEGTEGVVAATVTYANASGALLLLFSYAPEEQLEWTRSSAQKWADDVLAHNDAPPEKTLRKGIGWQQVLTVVILASILMLIRSIVQKKRNKTGTV